MSHNASITPEEVEKCKQRDLLEQLLAEMAGDFPKLSKIFVDERDAYMTHALHSLLLKNTLEKRLSWERMDVEWQPLRVVAVVGIGHTPGIAAHWDNPVDIAPLLYIPPPSTSTKVVRFACRAAFWGAIGFMLYRGGMRVVRRCLADASLVITFV
ncbi:hypothetical protein OESDEN_09239 [Oesophagostomum dentatum]|uniref:TraB family protein n=1 Tax=Oesophagostomum dentatum TaxID=61180 RepID=A0A0B1T675_OESDE|nr:hypothetical protein OESDEN_09239 [Oesophagostomum dentatum]